MIYIYGFWLWLRIADCVKFVIADLDTKIGTKAINILAAGHHGATLYMFYLVMHVRSHTVTTG